MGHYFLDTQYLLDIIAPIEFKSSFVIEYNFKSNHIRIPPPKKKNLKT